jgi:hypothetical protein
MGPGAWAASRGSLPRTSASHSGSGPRPPSATRSRGGSRRAMVRAMARATAAGASRRTWRTHVFQARASRTMTSTCAWRRPVVMASGSSGCPAQEKTVRAHPVALIASTRGRMGGSRLSLGTGAEASGRLRHGTKPPRIAGAVPCAITWDRAARSWTVAILCGPAFDASAGMMTAVDCGRRATALAKGACRMIDVRSWHRRGHGGSGMRPTPRVAVAGVEEETP